MFILLFGGVFLFSKNPSTPKDGSPVNSTFLEPAGRQKTGGIINGNYADASPGAALSLVEFGDYQCPACGIVNPVIKQVLAEFGGKVNFAFKNFPLSQHANANISSYAAEAAGLQGKFWQMHDKLYETQDVWSNSPDPKPIFEGYAMDLGLDVDQFKADIESQKVKDMVRKDSGDGSAVGISFTPTFFLNGVRMDDASRIEDFRTAFEKALNK